jgi:hypothetical protein
MKFKVDLGKIKTREMVEIETSFGAAIKLMSRFMVDEVGDPIPEDEAYEKLMDMDMNEQQDATKQFTDAIIPNLKGRRS